MTSPKHTSSDLVEWLRRTVYRNSYYKDDTRVLVNPDGPEAADRIEALEAENERLREAGQKLNNHACHDDDCQIVTHGVWSDPIPCTCGYEDAWKAWSAALGDTQ